MFRKNNDTAYNALQAELKKLRDQFENYRLMVTVDFTEGSETKGHTFVALGGTGWGGHILWRKSIGVAPTPLHLAKAIEEAKAFGTELAGSRIPRFEGVS